MKGRQSASIWKGRDPANPLAAKKKVAKKGKRATVAQYADRPQPHGGRLNTGGTNPGAGRPPSKVREAATLLFEKRIKVLDQIAGSKKSTNSEKIAAVRTLGMFGPGVGSAQLDEKLRGNNTPREVRFVFVESPKVKR